MSNLFKEVQREEPYATHEIARSILDRRARGRRRDRIAEHIARGHHESSAPLDLSPSVAEEARLLAIRRELVVSVETAFNGEATVTDAVRAISLLPQLETVVEVTERGSTAGVVYLGE